MKCLQPTSRGTNFNRIPHYNLFYVSVSLGFCPSISSCFSIFFYLSKCFSLCAFLCLCISLYLMCFFFSLCVCLTMCPSLFLCLYPYASIHVSQWTCEVGFVYKSCKNFVTCKRKLCLGDNWSHFLLFLCSIIVLS